MSDLAAVVLAGGAARRMGGVPKPALPVGGVPMLARVLAALAGADPVVVVGPPSLAPLLPPGARLTCEDPPGAGPAAAAGAGLRALDPPAGPLVALLAADLPFLTADTLGRLREAVLAGGADQSDRAVLAGGADQVDGAVLVDDGGRPQWLCGVWRRSSVDGRLRAAAAGASVRGALAGLRVRHVVAQAHRAPPWFDCDTELDLHLAEEWSHADPG